MQSTYERTSDMDTVTRTHRAKTEPIASNNCGTAEVAVCQAVGGASLTVTASK